MLESMSDLLTTGEAARVLEVSESTIRLWDRNGRLTARRTAGGQRVFDATVVQALAEARQRLHDRRPWAPPRGSRGCRSHGLAAP